MCRVRGCGLTRGEAVPLFSLVSAVSRPMVAEAQPRAEGGLGVRAGPEWELGSVGGEPVGPLWLRGQREWKQWCLRLV